MYSLRQVSIQLNLYALDQASVGSHLYDFGDGIDFKTS